MIEFIKFSAAAIACMFAGSHLVYNYYQPMAVSKFFKKKFFLHFLN